MSNKIRVDFSQRNISYPVMRGNAPDARAVENFDALLEYEGLRLRRNAFTRRDEVNGRPIDDDFYVGLHDKALRTGFRCSLEFVHERVRAVALQHKRHPVKSYYDSLKWDRVRRLDTWLHDYMDAPDDEVTSAMGALTLIAAVRRIKHPGTKFDTMLVLEGNQGTGKSTALEILAIKKEWYTNNVSLKADAKVIIEQTQGKMIVEVPELVGLNGKDVDHVKALLSADHDAARLAYGRTTSEVGRQFVMISTVNVDAKHKRTSGYLKDPTGNRRFWPVLTGKIRTSLLRRDVDQLWAEAVYRETRGDDITLSRELWAAAAAKQKQRMVKDPFVEMIENKWGRRDGFIVSSNMFEVLGVKTRTQQDQTRIGLAMREAGFVHKKMRVAGDLKWVYCRGDSTERLPE